MQLKVNKLSPDAVLPQKAYNTDAAFDLTASRITTELNEVGELIIVYHTDLCMEIPKGYHGVIIPRASISKKPLEQTNSLSLISSEYRGEIYVKFRSTVPAIVPSAYKPGERFAQIILIKAEDAEIVEAPLGEGERGTNGYGSTGDKAFTNETTTSAPTGSQSLPETEVETINSETAPEGSGDAENSVEGA